MTVFMFVARSRYIFPDGCIHPNSIPASVADATAYGRAGGWQWHRWNRYRHADPQCHTATDWEAVRTRIFNPHRGRIQIRALHGDSRRQLPCAHHQYRHRHDHRPSLFRFLSHRWSFRRCWRAYVHLRQRRSRNAVLGNTNGLHHRSNHGRDAAGFGLHGRRWFLQHFGSGHSQREFQFDGQSGLLHRLIFGTSDPQDQCHLEDENV